MLVSRPSQVAIRATLFLALQPPGKLCPVHAIAKETRLPRPYLAKIMQQLIHAGLVRAFRGPGGGLELGKAPGVITLESVVQAIEGLPQNASCALGLQFCSEKNPCPLHPRWSRLRAEIRRLLEETTLASLMPRLPSSGGLGRPPWVQI
jgi:Rrf2 family protein